MDREDICNLQRLLNTLPATVDALTVDGLWGAATKEALASAVGPVNKPLIASYRALEDVLGKPGGVLTSLGRCTLPTPFKLAWSENTKITSFACHKSLEKVLTKIFKEAYDEYGAHEFARLGLDVFGGCYNDRAMTGSDKKSVHAWGAAVDLDPSNNQYAWTSKKAKFAHSDYDAWWDIVARNGGVSLGRECDKDWMHFQFCGVR